MGVKRVIEDARKRVEWECEGWSSHCTKEARDEWAEMVKKRCAIGPSPDTCAERRTDVMMFLNDDGYWKRSNIEPVRWRNEKEELRGWLYQNRVYEVSGSYSVEEQRLLVLEEADKERKLFEKLKMKHDSESSREIKYERLRIPEEVRIAVWRRDQGKCARCGSREHLEYDHILPVSKGGSNTVRNIELLCEKCNREKGAQV
jgi:hypothetical protein